MNFYFGQLAVGTRFFVNGNHYTKKSSRTAMMMGVIDIHHPTCLLYTSPSPRDS